ncbi:uncharacterized protein Dyak_GE25937, isoform A [Drosophila yakuba]|uniref:Uncharacterized protein, isoform A n=2 Tax=Drosophila yakuba TaxID=7245 RepID=B4PUL0_DROYA|nr:uncharacterized protein Dyak_GE25937, isoform A [Drosophila yakuba]
MQAWILPPSVEKPFLFASCIVHWNLLRLSHYKMPRKKSEDFYRTHGFTANLENGKYSATCHFCDKVLQNTALSRLSLHRQTCDARRGRTTVMYTSADEKDQDEAPRIKIQKISGDDDGGLGNANEGKEIIVKIQQILDDAEEAEKPKEQPRAKRGIRKRKLTKTEESGEQNIEFEISNVEIKNPEYAEYMDESKEHYILQHNPDDMANGSATIIEARPRNGLAALRAEKARAEISQFQSKTKFLKTETDNLKVERTLTMLKIQKLRLEIDALRD